MFVISQYLLNASGSFKTMNQVSVYSIMTGLVLYTSIYLYLLFYNEEYVSIFNKFIIYVVVIDILLSIFYYFNMSRELEYKRANVITEETNIESDDESLTSASENLESEASGDLESDDELESEESGDLESEELEGEQECHFEHGELEGTGQGPNGYDLESDDNGDNDDSCDNDDNGDNGELENDLQNLENDLKIDDIGIEFTGTFEQPVEIPNLIEIETPEQSAFIDEKKPAKRTYKKKTNAIGV